MRNRALISVLALAAAIPSMQAFAASGGAALGQQTGPGETVTRTAPDPVTVTRPEISGRAAYIDQIGTGNIAAINQSAPTAFARVAQQGDDNDARIDQDDAATGYADVAQRGDRNTTQVSQTGFGENILYAGQAGNDNRITVAQSGDGNASNGAILAQMGDANAINLTQNGGDNQARLMQDGTGNAMTATQNGAGNQLVWTQTGNNLSDLGITQNGGQAMQVTQTR